MGWVLWNCQCVGKVLAELEYNNENKQQQQEHNNNNIQATPQIFMFMLIIPLLSLFSFPISGFSMSLNFYLNFVLTFENLQEIYKVFLNFANLMLKLNENYINFCYVQNLFSSNHCYIHTYVFLSTFFSNTTHFYTHFLLFQLNKKYKFLFFPFTSFFSIFS